ncbi:hypothetical protein [Aliikangiella coralliicola]|uniref:Uncharacterized protein n=1 Tax=Aliikangiella coralliicola TaxID=2592383 RepID=A0A545UC12_9GAMM|nr:hypothetical protein [Aliikangiella coralliicola]TQV87008.1 hypothetical protein FLL46_14470 [Aliikangiella coralliicola]
MGLSECLNFSKKARESFIKDDFGELIDDSTYTYISENLEVTVLCLTKKKTIVVFVAAQDADIVDVAGIFVEQLTAKVSK